MEPARLVIRGLRLAARAARHVLPAALRERLETRFFRAVHHATRVTNDAYPQPTSPSDRGPGAG